MVAGARHVRERGPAARALAAISASRFLFGFTTLLTLLVYRNHLTDGHWLRGGLPGLTQVVVLSGVGTVTGALLTPPVVARTGKPVWITAVLLLGAGTMLAFGLPYTKASFLVAGLVLGFLQQAIKICVDTTVQEQVDDDFRGRVFSFYDTLFNVSFVASAALAAAFLPADGVSRTAIVGVAAGYLVTAVAFAVGSRRSAGVAG
jgi:MFS family permease